MRIHVLNLVCFDEQMLLLVPGDLQRLYKIFKRIFKLKNALVLIWKVKDIGRIHFKAIRKNIYKLL